MTTASSANGKECQWQITFATQYESGKSVTTAQPESTARHARRASYSVHNKQREREVAQTANGGNRNSCHSLARTSCSLYKASWSYRADDASA